MSGSVTVDERHLDKSHCLVRQVSEMWVTSHNSYGAAQRSRLALGFDRNENRLA